MFYRRRGANEVRRFQVYRTGTDNLSNPFPLWLQGMIMLNQIKVEDDCLQIHTFTGDWRRVGPSKVVLYDTFFGMMEMHESDFEQHWEAIQP
jgi:hypothetical protein